MKRILLTLLPFLFSFTMCGHREDPKPPLSKTPSTPKIKKCFQSFNRPLLYWDAVANFDDGRKIPVPSEVTYEVIVNFGRRSVKTEKNYLEDKEIAPGEKRCFSVVACYRGHKSQPSEPVCIIGKNPVEAVPQVRSVKSGDGFVEFKFSPSELNIEVFRNGKPPFITPYAILKEETAVWRDENVKNGRNYVYRFRFSKGNLKGKLTRPFRTVLEDRIPPMPPQNPVAYLTNGSCLILWEASPSKDTVGYLVKVGKKEFKTDGISLFVKGCRGRIEIFAVDKAGNLSKPALPEVIREKGSSSNGKQVRHAGNGELH